MTSTEETKAELIRRLEKALAPAHLSVVDESDLHRGHVGHVVGLATHFRIIIRAQCLAKLNRVARQRAVFAAVGDLMGNPIHAITIDAAGEAPTA